MSKVALAQPFLDYDTQNGGVGRVLNVNSTQTKLRNANASCKYLRKIGQKSRDNCKQFVVKYELCDFLDCAIVIRDKCILKYKICLLYT